MTPNLLILGGTREASALATRVAASGLDATLSYAGRVDTPRAQPIPTRIGGFGGVNGLVAYLLDHDITHLIDATHPFADQMSHNAVAACKTANVPLIALTRAPWQATDQDRWHHVPDIPAAIEALDGPTKRVFLGIGRTEVAGFAVRPQHHYLLRFVDTPSSPPPLRRLEIVVDRGPFSVEQDRDLLQKHRIDLVVSKNSGGSGARAKLDAARDLGLSVLMVDRPAVPRRLEVETIDEVMTWIAREA